MTAVVMRKEEERTVKTKTMLKKKRTMTIKLRMRLKCWEYLMFDSE